MITGLEGTTSSSVSSQSTESPQHRAGGGRGRGGGRGAGGAGGGGGLQCIQGKGRPGPLLTLNIMTFYSTKAIFIREISKDSILNYLNMVVLHIS